MDYRLLVVAGDNQDLHNLKQHLGDDVAVTQVTSANEALWEVRSTPPHAIIADMTLPDMSGLDLAEILPNFGVSTRVVLVSRTDGSISAASRCTPDSRRRWRQPASRPSAAIQSKNLSPWPCERQFASVMKSSISR